MVHGATSGIGVTAIQMAKAHGAKVIATARGADKAETARGLGADVAVDAKAEDFAEVAKREGGADVVLDMVGGDYFAKDLDALKLDGRIVFIASLGGGEVTLPIGRLMQKRGVVTGSRPPSKRWSGPGSPPGRCARRSMRPSPSTRPPPPTRTWRPGPTSARSCWSRTADDRASGVAPRARSFRVEPNHFF